MLLQWSTTVVKTTIEKYEEGIYNEIEFALPQHNMRNTEQVLTKLPNYSMRHSVQIQSKSTQKVFLNSKRIPEFEITEYECVIHWL